MRLLSLVSLATIAAACGPSEGTVHVHVYGEEYIEEEMPSDIFVDGWAVTYDKFLVSLGAVSVAAAGESPELQLAPMRVYDLAQPSGGEGWEVGEGDVPGGDYGDTGYRIAPAADAVAANATGADVTAMTDGGYAIWIEGTAKKDAQTLTFAWGFTEGTLYDECHSVATVDGDTAAVQLTIHGDHLFYDDLFSAAPNVAFDLVAAADADADGAVTQEELAATDITTQERYQVGSTDIEDLWSFIDHQTSTLGHIDGEGHCEVAERE